MPSLFVFLSHCNVHRHAAKGHNLRHKTTLSLSRRSNVSMSTVHIAQNIAPSPRRSHTSRSTVISHKLLARLSSRKRESICPQLSFSFFLSSKDIESMYVGRQRVRLSGATQRELTPRRLLVSARKPTHPTHGIILLFGVCKNLRWEWNVCST